MMKSKDHRLLLMHKGFLIVIFAYFLFKCFYFAYTSRIGVSPDEKFHLELIEYFKANHDFFVKQQDHYSILVTWQGQDRFFYHFIIGNILKITSFLPLDDLWVIRFINIFLALFNVFVFYKLTRLVTDNFLVIIGGLVVYTNILMFTFLSAFANYDNLLNLLCILIFYWLVLLHQTRNLKYLFYTIILFFIGIITKASILPFGVIILMTLLYSYEFKVKSILEDFYFQFRNNKQVKKAVILACLIAVLPAAVLTKNVIKYNKPILLGCTDVCSKESCREVDLVNSYVKLNAENKGVPRISAMDYYDGWVDIMLDRVFGIFGHVILVPHDTVNTIIKLTLIVFIVMFLAARFSFPQELKIFIFSFLFYYFVIAFVLNYSSYLKHGGEGAGVHGRYLFPVLSCFVIVFTYTFANFSKRKAFNIGLTALVGFIFICCEFPSFLSSGNRKNFEIPAVQRLSSGCLSGLDTLEYFKTFNVDGINIKYNSMPNKVKLDLSIKEREIIIVDYWEKISIVGWAFDRNKQVPSDKVVFEINGNYYESFYGVERNDVGEYYNDQSLNNTGFEMVIYPEFLHEKVNEVRLVNISDDGNSYYPPMKVLKISIEDFDSIEEQH